METLCNVVIDSDCSDWYFVEFNAQVCLIGHIYRDVPCTYPSCQLKEVVPSQGRELGYVYAEEMISVQCMLGYKGAVIDDDGSVLKLEDSEEYQCMWVSYL